MVVIETKKIPPSPEDLGEILRIKVDHEVSNKIEKIVRKVMEFFNETELARGSKNSSNKNDRVLLCQYIISTLNPDQIPKLDQVKEAINVLKDDLYWDQINTLAGNLKSL